MMHTINCAGQISKPFHAVQQAMTSIAPSIDAKR
jgi:hypothetical protein